MKQHPDPEKEKARLAALKYYQIMDTPVDETFDKLTALASLICDTPISLITLIDEDRQWFKSKIGTEISETPRNISFCHHAIEQTSIMEIPDATKDVRFQHNPLVTSGPHFRFYAGYPLIDPEGFAIGTLCVIDNKPKTLTDLQKQSLRLIGDEAISLVVKQRKNEELSQIGKIFNMSDDLVCVIGPDGDLIKLNPAFLKMLGWEEEALINVSFYHLLHEDDIPATKKEILKKDSGMAKMVFTNRCKTKDGEYRVIEWMATPEATSGNIFAIGRDITDEREKERILISNENRFRSFFENSQGLMCTHDLKGNFILVNSAGAGLLGYSAQEIQKMSLFDLVPEEYHKALHLYLQQIRRVGKATGLLNFRHKDGTLRVWMFNNIYEKDEHNYDYIIGNALDITERHRLEEDLKHTKEMLEETSKVARIGGWEFDIEQQKLYWSVITKQIHEVSQDFMPDMSAAINFYEDESRNKISEYVERSIKEGIGWDDEFQMMTAKGNKLWVRSIGNAEFVNGKCRRIYGTFQDINEKKKAAIEISSSRKQLHDLLQAASEVSIISTNAEGIIRVFNKGAEKMLGYTAEEMENLHSPALIHDADEVMAREKELSAEYGRPIYGVQAVVFKAAMEGSEQREWTYIRKDGSRIKVSLVVSSIREGDKITGYLGIGTDITAKKEVEQALIDEKSRLQAFVEHAPAAVAMFDRDIKYVAVSNRWLEEYKLVGHQIVGLSHYAVFPNISQEWRDIHSRSLAGAVEKNNEDRWRPPGWDYDQYLKWEVRPWYLFNGTIGGIMMFTQDITEVCLQREELKTAKKLAEQASLAKSEFLANMSHEIRTPLNGVIGFTDLLLKTNVNETQKQYLSIVNQSGNALLSIINDILDFSKIEAGKLELDIEKCDIYELGSQAADIISYQAQHKGLEMLLNISADLPRFIWTDQIRLKQVLINLLGNATKFTEKGEIELKIRGMEDPGNGEITVRFEVRDTGIGIRPEKQQKIFEAFSQEDISTTKKYGGTGLGLTISNRLLQLMGSYLQLRSVPDEGSSFYFDLKVRAEKGDAIRWEGIEEIKHVLIVDDNDNNRMILRQMLLLKQISSEEAKNGIEALSLLGRHKKYDVIFMDYHMPIMDGLETIKKIRENFYDSSGDQPIILLYSSSSDETVLKACEELNVNYRIVKPIKMQEMYDALSRLVKKEEKTAMVDEKSTTGIKRADKRALTVMLVEDNSFNMLLISTIVKRLLPHARVIEAADGLEAVEYCRNQLPDMILMDVQMPNMNGYEATMLIRSMSAERHVPIVALTAGNVKGEKEKCIEAGMDDFLAKPIVEEMVSQVLNKWLKSSFDTLSAEAQAAELRHLNIQRLFEFVDDDEDLLKEILRIAKRDLISSVKELENALVNKDRKQLNMAGHTLKGIALNAGMGELAKIGAAFEYTEAFDDSLLTPIFVSLKDEVAIIMPLLEKRIEDPFGRSRNKTIL